MITPFIWHILLINNLRLLSFVGIVYFSNGVVLLDISSDIIKSEQMFVYAVFSQPGSPPEAVNECLVNSEGNVVYE